MSRCAIRSTSAFGYCVAAWGFSLTAALSAGAQAPLPVGLEFQVNTYTTSHQTTPFGSVAVDAQGDFVVAWISNGSSGTDTDVRSVQAQRYASDGSTQAAEFQVNTNTTGDQFDAWVSAAPNGDFVVVWDGYGSTGTDTSVDSVQGQRYASNGTAQGV